MESLNQEVCYVQNPAIGAASLWRFVYGYYAKCSKPVPFPLLFIVLPIVFRKGLRDVIKHTNKNSGLSKVSEKLFKDKGNDNLCTINNSAIALRQLTLNSFSIAVSANLITIDTSTAMVYPANRMKKSPSNLHTKDIVDAAEKLGGWCAELSLQEICNWLKVRF